MSTALYLYIRRYPPYLEAVYVYILTSQNGVRKIKYIFACNTFCTNPQFVLHMQKFTATCFIQGVLSYLNNTAPAWDSTEFFLGFLKFVYWTICLAAAIVCSPTLGVRRTLAKRRWERLPALNPLTPNDHYSDRTASITSKRCILYIYSTNIGTEYFKHGIYSPLFSLQNAVCFIILTYLVPVLFTFYIQGVLKLKK